MTELEAFMREQHYNRVRKLAYTMMKYLWSKQMMRSDRAMIEHISTEVSQIAESLYKLREELKYENQT